MWRLQPGISADTLQQVYEQMRCKLRWKRCFTCCESKHREKKINYDCVHVTACGRPAQETENPQNPLVSLQPHCPYLQSRLLVITTVISGGWRLVPQPRHQDKVLAVEGGHRVRGHANLPHRALVIHGCCCETQPRCS